MTVRSMMPEPGPAAVAVRSMPCELCGAAGGTACSERGDHLARWLAACAGRRITRDDVDGVVRRLVVVTKWCVVPERAS